MSRALLPGLALVLAGSGIALTGAWRSLGLGGAYWILRLAVPAGWVLLVVGAARTARRRARARAPALLAAAAVGAAIPAAFSWLDVRHLESRQVRAGGRERSYHLYVPSGSGSRPLVVVLHGFLQGWRSARRLAGVEPLAGPEGVLVAYPEGHRWSWNDGDGRKPAARSGVDDVAFLRAVVDDVARRHEVDAERVYAIGFSNSAYLLTLRSCELADAFAGFGLVAGGAVPRRPPGCPGAPPIPAVFVVGAEDPALAALAGDEPGPLGVAARWAARNGCAGPEAVRRLPDTRRDGTRVRHATWSCPPGAEVVEYVVEGGGHAWPGGPHYFPALLIGRTSRDLDASRAILEFLLRQRRATRPVS